MHSVEWHINMVHFTTEKHPWRPASFPWSKCPQNTHRKFVWGSRVSMGHALMGLYGCPKIFVGSGLWAYGTCGLLCRLFQVTHTACGDKTVAFMGHVGDSVGYCSYPAACEDRAQGLIGQVQYCVGCCRDARHACTLCCYVVQDISYRVMQNTTFL